MFDEIVKTLQEQLSKKDEQISYLQKENERLHNDLERSQVLHAGTIQQVKLLEDTETKKKRSIFDFLRKDR